MTLASSRGDETLPSLSRFIAGLIGPVLIALALATLLDDRIVPAIAAETSKSIGLIVLSGVVLLVAGLSIVQCHSSWHGWPAIVTAIGWGSVISGLARIMLPFKIAELATSWTSSPMFMAAAVVFGLLGVFLTLKAYS